MMSLAVIRELSRERAVLAAEARLEPFLVEAEDLEDWRRTIEAGKQPRLPFPNVGDYRPEGWELKDTLFCDKSGFGAPWEPALTAEQLIERLEVGKGYAIIEEGEFQLYLGEFLQE
jgi:hypothetical protein